MNDIPLDEILEEGVSSDERGYTSGFRLLRKGPVIPEAYLSWLWLKNNDGHKEELQDGTLELLCAWFPKQKEGIHELSRQYGVNLLQKAFEMVTARAELLVQSYEDLLFLKFQDQLRKLGYPIASEGHA